MSKNMENHIELKQKYHMDLLLKALLKEQKHNKCLKDKIRRSEMEHESANTAMHTGILPAIKET